MNEDQYREVIKQMPKDIFDGNCKDCPSLEHCLAMGVGCYKVIPRETYSAGHNEEFIKLKMIEPLDRAVVFHKDADETIGENGYETNNK